MKDFPALIPANLRDCVTLLRYILKERPRDISDFENLKNVFPFGTRKVGKVPTGSADVDPTDRLGDLNFDPDYLYILVDDAGTAEWRRTALSSW